MKYWKYWFKNVWLAMCGGVTIPKLTKEEKAAKEKYSVGGTHPTHFEIRC